jgi:DNA topoisomerase-1
LKLFVIESPGKIKTIQKFVDNDVVIKASCGHTYTISSDSDIDFNNNYLPKYHIIEGKSKIVKEIKDLAKKADIIYFASDADREGMAISCLLRDNILSKADLKKAKRIVYNEITKSAILKAIENPVDFDENLFHAQQARSVLDLLVGFRVSPVLWQKVSSGTSAGRVQSIGLRLIVDRHKEIQAFVPKEYWTIKGQFKNAANNKIEAVYHNEGDIPCETTAKQLEQALNGLSDYYVASINKTTKSKQPYPIFNTSSLQQFASSSYNWDGKYCMGLAQKLYEAGLITYHRTDSLNISKEAISDVRNHIIRNYGKNYVAKQVREFKSKNKVAQEAHEGIRPSHLEYTLDDVAKRVDDKEFKLYKAIHARFVACQMNDALLDSSKIIIKSKSSKHEFWATGQVINFDGYLKVWGEFSSTKDEALISLAENEKMILESLKTEQHFTKPPAMYNTATLVKVLEEEGIGRPSTYATIIDTLIKRLYVEKEGKSFKPTELGIKVSDFLVEHFPELMDKKYTARIEDQLDDIANGDKVWYNAVDEFYQELKKRILASKAVQSLKVVEDSGILCPKCKRHNLVKRKGKFGSFYGCVGFTDKEDKCDAIFKIGEKGEPIESVREKKYVEGKLCKCGGRLVLRKGFKSGKDFSGCEKYPKCKKIYTVDGDPIDF